LTIKFSQDKKCRYSIVKDQTFIEQTFIYPFPPTGGDRSLWTSLGKDWWS